MAFQLQPGDPLLQMMSPQQTPSQAVTMAPSRPVTMAPQVQHPMHAMIAPISAPQMSPLEQQEGQQDTRLMADYAKDNNPWGTATNHPGFFGKLGHLGSQLIQNAQHVEGQMTPREAEESRLQKGIQGLEADRSKEGLEGAQANLAGANAGHIEAETPEVAPNAASERGLQGAQAGNLESETRDRDAAAAFGPSLATAYAHRVNQVLTDGGDPSTDPVVQHLQDAITGIQKQSPDPTGPKTIPKQINGKEHTFAYDSKTGDYTRDEGETGQKPPVVRVETPGEERGAKNDILKAYTPTLESAERMNVMTDAYEKAIKNHDQQAMLNLLANHLGMTMGLQKGSRLTRDIIREAQQSQPWLQGMEARFDKDGYLSGVTLSPNQMRQMVGLGQQRYAEDAKKSRATAQYLGAKDDGPQRIPGKATINYYLAQSGGDAAKAKQLAAEDGWSVR